MNLREGLWRVAVAAGAIGALGGIFISYLLLSTAVEQQFKHQEFARLAASPEVKGVMELSLEKRRALLERGYEGAGAGTWIDLNGANVHSASFGIDGDLRTINPVRGPLLESTDEPEASSYIYGAVAPFIGFAIPWGMLLAIRWVVCGFLSQASSKQHGLQAGPLKE